VPYLVIWSVEGVLRRRVFDRRKFDNIVITLEEYLLKTGILDVELFMFTNRFVSENAFYSPILFKLVLRICLLEMHGAWKLHVIHISGKRMN
jgi:hypothetical protein